MAHLPHLEMFVGEDQEIIWPCPKQMVWELFELHKVCIYAKSVSGCVETLLEENWTDTIVSLPDGANRWPNAPEIMVTNSTLTLIPSPDRLAYQLLSTVYCVRSLFGFG